MLCKYGCGKESKFFLKDGSGRCNDSQTKCSEIKKKTCWNKGLTKETSELIKRDSDRQKEYYKTHDGVFKGKKHTQETKDKIGKALIGNNHAKHQGNKGVFYKGMQMDSSWEVAVAKYLDEHNIIWKYEEKRFPVLINETYLPDFFIYKLDGSFEKIIEVKGYFRKKNREKYEDFLKKYPEIQIELWQWKELRERNLINSGGYVILAR